MLIMREHQKDYKKNGLNVKNGLLYIIAGGTAFAGISPFVMWN